MKSLRPRSGATGAPGAGRRAGLALLAAAALALAGLFAAPPLAAAPGGAQGPPQPPPPPPDPAETLSATPIEPLDGWRELVLDSPGPYVYPRRVSVTGDVAAVSDPEGLTTAGGITTTITGAAAGTTSIVLDLGLNTGGQVQVGVVGASGGPLRVSYSEARQYLGPSGDTRGVASLGINDDPDGRAELISSPGVYGSPGIRGAQRYLQITLDGPGTFTLDFVRVRISHLRPRPADYGGHFLSSSSLLNRIWYASAYTLNLDSVNDPRRPSSKPKMLDGAKRDRLIWLGDLAMESLAGHYTVRQMADVIDRSIDSFGCQQYGDGYIPMASDVHVACPGGPGPPDGPPPSTSVSFPSLIVEDRLPQYTPFFVITACDRFTLTGDAAGTRRLLPVLRRAAAYLDSKAVPGGLFNTPEVAINWRAFDDAVGIDSYTNALWVRALKCLAEVEAEIGDAERAIEYRSRAKRLGRRLVAVLYDPAAHMFRTNTESPVPNHPQDATVEAVLAGILPPEEAERALRALRNRLWSRYGPLTGESSADPYVSRYISPFMSGWELLARLQLHEEESARELLEDLWGRMLRFGPGTVWEAMAPEGRPVSFFNRSTNFSIYRGRTSLAHGWGAAPVPALSGYVAGLRPREPGWERWIVEPQTLDLKFAQATVETPRGRLASRWRLGSGERSFKLTVVSPPGAPGTVSVPLLGRGRTIARDGRVVWRRGRPAPGVRASRDDGYVRFPQGPGRHTYAWNQG